jgi:hypothetical protein
LIGNGHESCQLQKQLLMNALLSPRVFDIRHILHSIVIYTFLFGSAPFDPCPVSGRPRPRHDSTVVPRRPNQARNISALDRDRGGRRRRPTKNGNRDRRPHDRDRPPMLRVAARPLAMTPCRRAKETRTTARSPTGLVRRARFRTDLESH